MLDTFTLLALVFAVWYPCLRWLVESWRRAEDVIDEARRFWDD